MKNENILSQFPLYKNPIRQVVFYPNNIKFKNKSDNCKNKDTLSARRLSLLLQYNSIQSFCVFIGWKMKIFYHSSLYIKNPIRQVVFYPNNIKFKNKSDNCKNKDTLSARRLSLLLQYNSIQSFCVFIGWKMKIFYHSSLYIKTPLDRLFSTQIT